jgi:hypothetical protein
MAPDWQAVESDRITHEAYDPDAEAIYVRFPGGVEWQYSLCPPAVWAAFTSQSRGKYIADELNYKPHGPYTG